MAEEVRVFQVIDNRYAVDGSYVRAMYQTSLFDEKLSIAQLVSAVSVRMAAASEARAINTMNRLLGNTRFSMLLSDVVRKLTEVPNGSNKISWSSDVWDLVKGGSITKDQYECRSPEFRASPTLKNYFQFECALGTTATLPGDFDNAETLNYTKTRLDAYAMLRPKMEDVTRSSELLQVDVETAIGRRDVSLSTASNVVKAFSTSMLNTARALKV